MSKVLARARSYHISLLQSTSHRIFQESLTNTLAPYHLNIPEWKLLGLTTEKIAQRHADLAQLVDVERPLVTAVIDALEKKGFVRRTRDSIDRRAKIIMATPQGVALIREIEPKIRLAMKHVLHSITDNELTVYIKVLTTISRNGRSIKINS